MRLERGVTGHQHRHAVQLTVAAAERKSFLLRIPPDLWKDLEKWAADDLRSVNAQIEFLLRQAVARRRGGGPGQEP